MFIKDNNLNTQRIIVFSYFCYLKTILHGKSFLYRQKDHDLNSFEFFRSYMNNASPVGFETSGQKIWLEYLTPYVDTHYVDPYGTAVGVINPDNKFKVVIEAHADEISWFVNYITNEGLIYLKRNGGVDHQTAPASRVFIHGKKGPVKAVFGWPAIHTRHGNPDTERTASKTR